MVGGGSRPPRRTPWLDVGWGQLKRPFARSIFSFGSSIRKRKTFTDLARHNVLGERRGLDPPSKLKGGLDPYPPRRFLILTGLWLYFSVCWMLVNGFACLWDAACVLFVHEPVFLHVCVCLCFRCVRMALLLLQCLDVPLHGLASVYVFVILNHHFLA